jgi:hypothetical protein
LVEQVVGAVIAVVAAVVMMEVTMMTGRMSTGRYRIYHFDCSSRESKVKSERGRARGYEEQRLVRNTDDMMWQR